MKILVINCGSSSVKFSLFEASDGTMRRLAGGLLEKIGEEGSRLIYHDLPDGSHTLEQRVGAGGRRAAFDPIVAALRNGLLAQGDPDAIGHRVVHGGELFTGPVLIDDEISAQIQKLGELAPLHNPVNLLGIEICHQVFPCSPQIAVFDTAFHQTLPPRAHRYAAPERWRENGIRRYGFHGVSHFYLAKKAAGYLGQPLESLRLIVLHLGNGASATAIADGKSRDTSMGFTPAEGLVMGTRVGDIDPLAVLYQAESSGIEQTRKDLLHQSGLKGLCGSNDMREILAREALGDGEARLAVEIYCYRIKKYIGAYFAILGGIDALIFSGGVGENSASIRMRVCEGLECLGLVVDPAVRNWPPGSDVLEIQAPGKTPYILAIHTDEELEIARQTLSIMQRSSSPGMPTMPVTPD